MIDPNEQPVTQHPLKLLKCLSKQNRSLASCTAMLMLTLALAPGATRAEVEPLDDESMVEYITIEEILQEDDTKSGESPSTEETFELDAEYVNLKEILYGTSDEKEIAKIQETETSDKTVEPRALDTKTETLKQKVLAINRDLFMLEEDLLFPSSTQVNVFVSIDPGHYFNLDGVNLKIDDKPVQNHLYTEREKTALERGAVQRIYTGNLRTGEHEIVAIITGLGPENREYRRAVNLDFIKNNGTKYIELRIIGDTVRKQPIFQLREWD